MLRYSPKSTQGKMPNLIKRKHTLLGPLIRQQNLGPGPKVQKAEAEPSSYLPKTNPITTNSQSILGENKV